jgi:hypothetical protein
LKRFAIKILYAKFSIFYAKIIFATDILSWFLQRIQHDNQYDNPPRCTTCPVKKEANTTVRNEMKDDRLNVGKRMPCVEKLSQDEKRREQTASKR